MARPKRTPEITIGQRFGRLTVLSITESTKRHGPRFLCECTCGNIKPVVGYDLHSGNTRSCGCLGFENRTRAVTTHGMSTSPEYRIWGNMRRRCYDKSSKDYPDYGGRGIVVCEQWATFDGFFADMGQRPSPQHTLDRKDNDGPYSPDNCRWALPLVQMNNKRCNRLITFRGKTQTMMQWVRELSHLNMTRPALEHRLKRNWPLEQAMTTKVSPFTKRFQNERNEKGQFIKKQVQ